MLFFLLPLLFPPNQSSKKQLPVHIIYLRFLNKFSIYDEILSDISRFWNDIDNIRLINRIVDPLNSLLNSLVLLSHTRSARFILLALLNNNPCRVEDIFYRGRLSLTPLKKARWPELITSSNISQCLNEKRHYRAGPERRVKSGVYRSRARVLYHEQRDTTCLNTLPSEGMTRILGDTRPRSLWPLSPPLSLSLSRVTITRDAHVVLWFTTLYISPRC